MKTQVLPLATSLAFLIAVGCTNQVPKTKGAKNTTKETPLDLDGYTTEEASALVQDYASWQKLVDHPMAMSADVIALCLPPSLVREQGRVLPEKVQATGENPHQKYYAMVYLNEDGLEPIDEADDERRGSMYGYTRNAIIPFPIGTVIVKGKYKDVDDSDFYKHVVGDPELLTVMVKREEGYNPEVGDWWFGTFDAKGNPTSGGKLEPCMSCHKTQKDNDFIFTGNEGENSMYKTR